MSDDMLVSVFAWIDVGYIVFVVRLVYCRLSRYDMWILVCLLSAFFFLGGFDSGC